MEIGVLILLVASLIIGGFMEGTKPGHKFMKWCIKEMCGVDIDD